MNNPVLEIFIILLLLIANGIFAMSEIAIVSSRKARLQQAADEGIPQALAALKLANKPNDFLSTVQIGITLVGIFAGAFGGATIAEELEAYLDNFPALVRYSELISVGIVVLVITYFSLVIGELVPKRLALNNPERIATSIASPMRMLTTIVSPFVRILSISTDVVIRILGIRPSNEPPITEEELKVLIEQGTQVGVFEEAEQDMIEGVLRLGERRVGALMTPRSQVIWISLDDSTEEIRQKVHNSRYSRFPLVESSLDDVVGIVYTKDLLVQSLGGEELDLNSIANEPVFVLENFPALKALQLFKEKGAHSALVVDEYGVVQGIITHNDIMEGIIGFMPYLGMGEEPKMVQREDGSFLVDGLFSIDDLKEILEIEEFPDEKTGFYHTIGGFIFSQMGKIPLAGEGFVWGDYYFEVVDMDFHRVDKVLIKKA